MREALRNGERCIRSTWNGRARPTCRPRGQRTRRGHRPAARGDSRRRPRRSRTPRRRRCGSTARRHRRASVPHPSAAHPSPSVRRACPSTHARSCGPCGSAGGENAMREAPGSSSGPECSVPDPHGIWQEMHAVTLAREGRCGNITRLHARAGRQRHRQGRFEATCRASAHSHKIVDCCESGASSCTIRRTCSLSAARTLGPLSQASATALVRHLVPRHSTRRVRTPTPGVRTSPLAVPEACVRTRRSCTRWNLC